MRSDTIKKYIIAIALLSGIAAFVHFKLIGYKGYSSSDIDPSDPCYGYLSYDDDYADDCRPDPTSVSGITEEKFRELYPEYEIGTVYEEYSVLPVGQIFKVETDVTAQSYKAVDLYISCGTAAEYDKYALQNLIDPEEYFSSHDGDEKLVSHNEFYLPDGQLCTVDIRSESIKEKDGNIIYRGEKFLEITIGDEPMRTAYAAFSTEQDTAPAITYSERFALKPDDYNGDGCPDFCLRVGTSDHDGADYYMHFLKPYNKEKTRHHDGVKTRFDDGFYVYGENEPSIRLDRIDRNAYYFLSKDKYGNIIPAVYDNSGTMLESEKYINNGLIFSSRFENGQLSIKARNISEESCTYTPEMTVKRLDGKVWRDTDIILPVTGFSAESFQSDEKLFDIGFDKGEYRIELCINETYTRTEFSVR